MLTEQAHKFSADSMRSVAATLYWREVTAEVDCELGHISRTEYHKIRRLLAKAERELNRRCSLPYVHKYHKGEYVIGGAEWELQLHDFNVNSIWVLSSKLCKQCCDAIVNKAPEAEINRLLHLSDKARQLYCARLQKALSQTRALSQAEAAAC